MPQKDDLRKPAPVHENRVHSQSHRVGVYIQARDTTEAIIRIREAEHAGVKLAWMAMGGAGFADILTVLAVAATRTERIKLGTAIVPASTRDPLVMAQQALAVHDLAPERLRLGVGSGNPLFLESRYGLSQRAPLSYLKEYLEVQGQGFRSPITPVQKTRNPCPCPPRTPLSPPTAETTFSSSQK